MNTPWISVEDKLPDEGTYVLVHLTKTNWRSSEDPEGVYYKVVRLKKGISKEERQLMKEGKLSDSDDFGWSGDPVKLETFKRSSSIHGCDEDANNKRPYNWESFGPGSYFGQEVDRWMEIPRP